MVKFEKDRYMIDIRTGTNPVENFLALQEEIAYVFSVMRPDILPDEGLPQLGILLMNLQPDWDTARKMGE